MASEARPLRRPTPELQGYRKIEGADLFWLIERAVPAARAARPFATLSRTYHGHGGGAPLPLGQDQEPGASGVRPRAGSVLRAAVGALRSLQVNAIEVTTNVGYWTDTPGRLLTARRLRARATTLSASRMTAGFQFYRLIQIGVDQLGAGEGSAA